MTSDMVCSTGFHAHFNFTHGTLYRSLYLLLHILHSGRFLQQIIQYATNSRFIGKRKLFQRTSEYSPDIFS